MTKQWVLALAAPLCLSAAVTPEGLRCEYRKSPLNVDAERPRLSWTLTSNERAQRQTAYRVVVASTADRLERGVGDLWDSGKVASGAAAQVEYAGKKLGSFQRCFWKVQAWDKDGQAGPWSAAAEWAMGVLRPEDWKGDWIADARAPMTRPMPRFRKKFEVAKAVKRAVVYASAGGFYELYLNGEKVGDEVLAPLWTNYRKSVLYGAFDVTRQMKRGANVFAAELGNGFYSIPGGRYVKFTGSFGAPVLLVMARIEYEDGTVETVGTNGSWKLKSGPTVFSCIHGGEDFDARLDEPGWMTAEFDDSKWRGAGFDGQPGGPVVAQAAAGVKVMKRYEAVKVTEPAAGVRVYDLGQNLAGWPRVKVRGKAGSFVKMATAELLNAEGRLDTRSATGSAAQSVYFTYTLRGEGVEEWHPKFAYTGFRYVEVTGDAEVVSLGADYVHNSTERAGSFTSSSELFNRTNELVDYAVRANFQSVLTDCPHREKLGWLEVAHLMGPSILYNFDAGPFYGKIARDTREAQTDAGLVPDIAPEYTVFRGGFRDSPEWGSAVAAVPWLMYRWYGDKRALSESYAAMAKYDEYLAGMSKDSILTHGLGDWYDVGPGGPGASKLTPRGVTATAFRYQNLRILEESAGLLGKAAERASYAAEAETVKRRFNETFWDAGKSYYGTGSQAAQAIALVMGLAPESARAGVLQQLAGDIHARGDQQTAGDIGYRFVVRALTDAGRGDVLYAVNSRTNAPSYGYQIAQGVTSLAEAWDADAASSQNHCMLGHVQEWFITGLAGIDQMPGSAGFERILIRPGVVGELKSAGGHYDSIRGRIESRWRVEGSDLKMDVTIPVNAAAEVWVPARSAESVKESGREGWKFLRMERGAAVFEVGSGRYAFTSEKFR